MGGLNVRKWLILIIVRAKDATKAKLFFISSHLFTWGINYIPTVPQVQILFAWYLDNRAQSHSVCLILGQPRWELFLATRSASTADSAATRDCSLTSATKKRWRRKIKKWQNWKAVLSQTYVMCVREGRRNQNGWIFGKNPKGGGVGIQKCHISNHF